MQVFQKNHNAERSKNIQSRIGYLTLNFSNNHTILLYCLCSYRQISDVVGVVLDPPQNETIQNKIIIHFSHNEVK